MKNSEFLVKIAEIIIEILKEIRQNNQSLSKENLVEYLGKNEKFEKLFSEYGCNECIDGIALKLLKVLEDLRGVFPDEQLNGYREIFKNGTTDEKRSTFIDFVLNLIERLENTLGAFEKVKSLIKDIAINLEETTNLLNDSFDKSLNIVQSTINNDKTIINDIEGTVNEIDKAQSIEILKLDLSKKLNEINKKIRETLKEREDFVTYASEKKEDINSLKTSFKSKSEEIEVIKQQLEQYKKQVIKDFLTGLYNRKYFEEMLEKCIDAYKRYGQKFSLLFIDIDDFKKINDTLGHIAGDFVLQYIANILKKNTRKLDLIFRYGGDEFVVLMPNTTLKKAKFVAERIANAIKNTVFKYKSSNVSLTVSIGMEEIKDEYTGKEVLEMADKKMLKAKTMGKDKVVSEL